jgi:hypothetical protein
LERRRLPNKGSVVPINNITPNSNMGKNRDKQKSKSGKHNAPAARPGNSFSEAFSSRSHVPGGMSRSELLALTFANSPSHRNQTSSLLADYVADHILLIGEGDFSFSKAFLKAWESPSFRPPNATKKPKLTATSLDTLAQASQKYGGAVNKTVSGLKGSGNTVLHGVDATSLSKNPDLVPGQYDRIVFNFPHKSGAKTQAEDVKENRKLLSAFFKEARAFVPDPAISVGKVLISLRTTSFYESWEVAELANKAGWVLDKPRSEFQADLWITLGYSPVRTHPAFREAPSVEGACNYVFRRAMEGELAAGVEKGEDDEENDAEGDAMDEDGEEEAEPKSIAKSPSRKDRREAKQGSGSKDRRHSKGPPSSDKHSKGGKGDQKPGKPFKHSKDGRVEKNSKRR